MSIARECYICGRAGHVVYCAPKLPICSACEASWIEPAPIAAPPVPVAAPRATAPSFTLRLSLKCEGVQLKPNAAKWCGKHGPLGANQFPHTVLPLCEVHHCSENVCYCH